MKRIVFFALLCSVLSIPNVQAFQAPQRAQDSIALVEKAVDLFQEKGQEYAVRVINSKLALTDKELYVFALDMGNNMLAHPYKPSLVGKNCNDILDKDGKPFFRTFRKTAENPGRGWVDYLWTRPGEEAPRFKRAFIMKVPGQDVYVGSGYYPALPADKID